MGRSIFVTGTGTDIGKSALSLAILLWARQRGLKAAYYKPIQCGSFPFGPDSGDYTDATWIQTFIPESISTHVTYTFPSAVSPHLAAEREGQKIHLGNI